jgi:hypothetical protein
MGELKVVGIDDIKESIKKLKELSDNVSVMLADGKVDWKDFKGIPEMVADIRELVVALKGVKGEVQDLSAEEMKIVLADVLELGLHIASKFGFSVE